MDIAPHGCRHQSWLASAVRRNPNRRRIFEIVSDIQSLDLLTMLVTHHTLINNNKVITLHHTTTITQ